MYQDRRDIWNRETWTHTTADLFEEEKSQTINRSNLQYLDLKVCGIFVPIFEACLELHFYLSQDLSGQYCPFKAGRPKGSRDKKPRVKKVGKTATKALGATIPGNCTHGNDAHGPAQVMESWFTPRDSPSMQRDQVDPGFAWFSQDPSLPLAPFLWYNEPITGDPGPFGPSDPACAALDAAVPAEGTLCSVDPFHFDWPYW